MVLTPRRWRQVARGACRPDRVRQATSPRGDGGKRARSPRRARRTPLKLPCREGRMIRLYLWFCRVHFFCTRTMGASGHPAFPAPSCLTGADEFQNFGRVAPRDYECMSVEHSMSATRHCEEHLRRSNPESFSWPLDCFAGARNDGDGNARLVADRDSVLRGGETEIILKHG